MNTKLIAGTALSGLILAGGIAGTVSAQSVADATNLTEEQVIELALAEVAGEVTEVELEERRGTQFYEVEILAEDGTEMEVKVAADSGEILRVKAEGERSKGGKDCDKDDAEDDINEQDA